MVTGIRRFASDCEAYQAGKSLDDVMEEYGLTDVVKMGSNENPYGPYPAALQAALAEASRLNTYPERNFIRLRELLGERFSLPPEAVALGHGAGGVLETIAKTLLDEGDEVVVPRQSYRLYPEISKIMGASVREVSLGDDFRIDVDAMVAAITESTKIVWLCNPNNPTGTTIDPSRVQDLLDALPPTGWLVLDEAYAEFSDAGALPDSAGLVRSGRRVIVVRTFSKYHGLAGARVGYALATPDLVTMIDTVAEPFNANRIGLAAAVATLTDDREAALRAEREIIASRTLLEEQLAALGCQVVTSQANFIFFSTPRPASDVAEALLRRGVIIRGCAAWGYPHHLRVTVGRPADAKLFLRELRAVLETPATAATGEPAEGSGAVA